MKNSQYYQKVKPVKNRHASSRATSILNRHCSALTNLKQNSKKNIVQLKQISKGVKIPVRVINRDKNPLNLGNYPLNRGLKIAGSLALVLLFILFQSNLFWPFESHIINTTALICDFAEIHTIGYWKNHENIYIYLLPQNLGPESIITFEEADNVFNNANSSEMREMLKAQLLAMKFNIAYFGIGEYLVETEGKTLNQIVAEADALLIQQPEPEREVLEAMKDLLDSLNNLSQIKYCAPPPPNFGSYIVINEVYYDVGNKTHCDTYQEEDPANEWFELYNPTDSSIDISGWAIEDNFASDQIPSSASIPPKGFAVVAKDSSTWQFWSIPDEAVKIELGSLIGNGLNNDGDRVILKDNFGKEIDAVSYGEDSYAFSPSAADVAEGHSIARSPKGYDTNQASDWIDLILSDPGTNPANISKTEPPCPVGPTEAQTDQADQSVQTNQANQTDTTDLAIESQPIEEPAPEPSAEPSPEPTLEPALEPTPEPTPESALGTTPGPTPEPTPEPSPAPTTEPSPEPTPESTPEPTPGPTAESSNSQE